MLRKLKTEFKQRIKDDEALQLKIAQAFHKKIITVKRWNEAEDVILTTQTVLDILRHHEGLEDSVELTEENPSAPVAANL
jgi:hypothetical protein